MSLVNKVLTKLQFSKTWLSKENFPTYEMREDQVRADMQYLHDETKTAFNNLVDDLESLSAENIPFTSSTAVPATDLQSAVENVQQQVAEASVATIPTASLTDEKFATGVPTNKADLVNGAVKGSQLRFREAPVGMVVNPKLYTLSKDAISCFVEFPDPWGAQVIIPDSSDIPVGSVFLVVAYNGYTPIERPLTFLGANSNVHLYTPGSYTYVTSYSTTEFSALFMLIKIGASSWFIGRLS